MTTSVLHISDLHLGPPFVPHVADALLRIVPSLNCDAIVVSGDLTQRAKPEQFAEAAELLGRLPNVPQLVIPGNHDIALWRVVERLFRPYELYRHHITEELDPVLQLNGAVIIGLNSTSPRRAITNGRIHLEQLERCADIVRDLPPGIVKIVVAHHHFAPAPDYERDQTMPRAKRAMERFIDWGVDMILGGHLHRAYIGNSLDVYPAQRDHGVIIVQCGTTTSRRGRGKEREKNSFNLIRFDELAFEITHYVYFSDRDGFEPISRHVFPRSGLTLRTVNDV